MYNNNFYPYYNYGYAKPNMFSKLSGLARGGKFNWSSILNNTQKTLNIINQAIPVIYQIKPIYNNAKTIFKVMNAVKDSDVTINTTKEKKESPIQETEKKEESDNSPTFFL